MGLRVAAACLGLTFGGLFAGEANSQNIDFRIAATVAPVHSLVSMVADGIASPDLIIRPGASPHSYALKPSEAQALNDADVVFRIGQGLEPWMEKALGTLASDAVVIELGEIDGVHQLAMREGGVWAAHDHEHEGQGDHDHAGRVDPHLWLDPYNALVWIDKIAETLAEHDPAHADDYRRNAKAAVHSIETAVTDIEGLLQPVNEKPYVVFHDAYQYFEHRFDLHPLGAIRLGDADRPGPARLIEIKEMIAKSGAVCIFAEPQFEPKLIDTIAEGSEIKRGMLDPIGAELEPGAALYPSLLRELASTIADCLA